MYSRGGERACVVSSMPICPSSYQDDENLPISLSKSQHDDSMTNVIDDVSVKLTG